MRQNRFNSHRKKLNDITSKYKKFKNEFIEIEKELKLFKKEYEFKTKLKSIRNKTIAHIDEDFKSYYDNLSTLDKKYTIRMIENFIAINIKYLELSADLLNAK